MIGSRLKEERVRLGYNQPDFAALANASKRTLIDWEKDVSSPTAAQMAAFSCAGADIQYIVTGLRSKDVVSTDENLILEKFRSASAEIKNKMLMLLLSGETTNNVVNNSVNSGNGNQYNGTNQTINNNAAPSKSKDVSIKAKGKHAQAAYNIKNE